MSHLMERLIVGVMTTNLIRDSAFGPQPVCCEKTEIVECVVDANFKWRCR
jgi:hypothetical protein